MHVMGVTFTVYTEEDGSIDRAWPFDIIPRVIARDEWVRIEEGLRQRVQALNLFIDDLYHEQRIIRDRIVPAELIMESKNFRSQCVGVSPPRGVWAHICGSDLVRDRDGTMYVSRTIAFRRNHMIENRAVMKRVFPDLFQATPSSRSTTIRPSSTTCWRRFAARRGSAEIVVLTPASTIPLLRASIWPSRWGRAGRAAICSSVTTIAFMRREGCALSHLSALDDLYRSRSVPSRFAARRARPVRARGGKVALANAPRAGVADDKVVPMPDHRYLIRMPCCR